MFCVYCGEKHEENKVLVAHRKECLKNPKSVTAIALEALKKNKQYLDIQNRINGFADLQDAIGDFLEAEGFNITWENFPTSYKTDLTIHNYDHTPLIVEESGLYGGWSGNFSGKITPIEGFDFKGKKNTCSFWDLNGDMSGRYGFKFLRADGGNWGSNFDGNGKILFNDFPLIYEKTKLDTKAKQASEDISKRCHLIKGELQRQENLKVSLDEFYNDCNDFVQKMQRSITAINTAKSAHEKKLRDKFRNETVVEMPEIETPMVDMFDYNVLRLKFENIKEPVVFDNEFIQDMRDGIDMSLEVFEEFHSRNAEHLI